LKLLAAFRQQKPLLAGQGAKGKMDLNRRKFSYPDYKRPDQNGQDRNIKFL